jgi:D-alanyl-lipoteichoic acid acyltransferase DltB (MBOAT superfamily)
MEPVSEPVAAPVSRTRILIRLLYTVLFLIVFGIVHAIINLVTVFQYILLLITLKESQPVRRFANQLAVYGYRVMRYLTLNDNVRPFPFSDFPQELEPPVGEVKFD